MAISPDGAWLASAGYDGTVRLWDAFDDSPRATLGGHQGWVWSVAISPDCAWLASASDDGTVRLWSVPSAPPVAALRMAGGLPGCRWHPTDLIRLAFAGTAGVGALKVILPPSDAIIGAEST